MSTTTYITDAVTLGTGLLLARLILGVLMVAHGGQKLFGWLGGYGHRRHRRVLRAAGLPSRPAVRHHRLPHRSWRAAS